MTLVKHIQAYFMKPGLAKKIEPFKTIVAMIFGRSLMNFHLYEELLSKPHEFT